MSELAEPVRTLRPVPPRLRPQRVRRTARVLLVDDLDRLLLFAGTDPGIPGSHWWETPGGGIDPGETELQAAVRELFEETGVRVAETDLVGPVMTRRVVHGYSDVVMSQENVFFACWVPAFDVTDAGYTAEERQVMTAHRWWTRDELAETADRLWPAGVLALWHETDARRGGPSSPPLDGGDVEESTVPAAAGS